MPQCVEIVACARGSAEKLILVRANQQVVAAAKAGAVAQCDVVLPAGPTGLEPTQTSFFQVRLFVSNASFSFRFDD